MADRPAGASPSDQPLPALGPARRLDGAARTGELPKVRPTAHWPDGHARPSRGPALESQRVSRPQRLPGAPTGRGSPSAPGARKAMRGRPDVYLGPPSVPHAQVVSTLQPISSCPGPCRSQSISSFMGPYHSQSISSCMGPCYSQSAAAWAHATANQQCKLYYSAVN